MWSIKLLYRIAAVSRDMDKRVVLFYIQGRGQIKYKQLYRWVTVLHILAKIFEIIALEPLEFINDAFACTDIYNGRFLKRSRTSNNLFILQSLIERQVNIGQSLIVCFIDLTKPFYLINRDILFFKIVISGFHGRFIDTLWAQYQKSACRIKHDGKLNRLFCKLLV